MSHTPFCRWSCWWVIGGLGLLGTVALLGAGTLREETPTETSAKRLPLLAGAKPKILWIGDSTSVGDKSKGGRTIKLLRDAGFTVEKNALGGRSANSFIAGSKKLKEPKKGVEQLQEAISSFGPNVAIIDLNTNDLAGFEVVSQKKFPAQFSSTKKSFEKIRDTLQDAGVRVIGIGAPHYPERSEFWPFEDDLNDLLKDIYGRKNFIDAGPLTGTYKMHAGGESAQAFAENLYAALSQKL